MSETVVHRFVGGTLYDTLKKQDELIVLIHYWDANEAPTSQEQLNKNSRRLTVRMSLQQASEFGSEIWRAAERLGHNPPQ
jgi:hypothetical protein